MINTIKNEIGMCWWDASLGWVVRERLFEEVNFALLSCDLFDAFYAKPGLSILFILIHSIHTVTL